MACLNDTVGEQQNAISRMQEEARLFIADFAENAEREIAGQRDLLAVEIGRQMSGVGDDQFAVGAEPGGLAGGEAVVADEYAIEDSRILAGLRSGMRRSAPISMDIPWLL